MAVGLLDGSAAVYDVHLLEDDLAPTLVGVIQPGRPAVPKRARARSWMDSDSDSDEEGTSGTSPPEAEAEAEPEAEAPGAEAEAEAEPEAEPEAEVAGGEGKDGLTQTVAGEANTDGDDAAESPSGSPSSGSPSGASKKSSKEKEKGGHLSAVTCAVFSPDGGSLYTGSRDGSVKRLSLIHI